MASTFTWLDYSEHERRKMLDVIELFGEKSTRDELGLGGVRDAFADLMFPGTSTIQTAAKYLLFVPWIYLELESRKTPAEKIALRARKREIELARQLESSGETEGVIGRRAKEKLQRLPSNIYWQGLYEWGIRVFPGSQDEYHRSLDHFYRRRRRSGIHRSEYDGETAEDSEPHNWHLGLPEPNEQFPEGATLALSWAEAEYLRERVLTHCGDSLLAYLLRERIEPGDVSFVWQLDVQLPARLASQVNHGRNFSVALHGAQLLYNLMLAQLSDSQRFIDEYHEQLEDWWQRVSNWMDDLQQWDRDEFWRIVRGMNPQISSRAKSFITAWVDHVISADSLAAIIGSRHARELVEHREVQLKRGLARLRSPRALELWGGAAGAAQLDLRWNSARRIATDILQGLEVEANA